jgi:hypothetical protein
MIIGRKTISRQLCRADLRLEPSMMVYMESGEENESPWQ